MAGEDREPDAGLDPVAASGGPETPGVTPAIEALFARLEAAPWDFHPYMAMRLLEAAWPELPRLGESTRLREDAVRFSQEPTLAFAPSSLASFERVRGTPRLAQYFLGLFGPNAPMPFHLTEYARERERNYRDATFRRFADVFHHRVTQLFYRAWADANPVAHADRPADDRFALYLGSLMGMGLEGLRGRDALPDEVRLHWAGLFAMPTRPAEGLERILAGYFGGPVEVEPLRGHWIDIPRPMLSRLGGEECGLGTTATLGERVWDCAGKFRVVVGPVGYEAFSRLLPGTDSLARLRSLVHAWTGGTLWWDLQVVLKKDEIPRTRLDGGSGLGWTTWLLSGRATRDAHEYVIDPVSLAG